MNQINQLFKRVFTKELEHSDKTVYDLFTWQTVDVILKNYQTGVEVLKSIKKALDPKGILNPGKVWPEEEAIHD